MQQIQHLLDNGWIEECNGQWVSKIVLAPKPHQESCTSIEDFIWHMCISYCAIYIGPYKVVIDSKTIIDDILSYCCTKELLIVYFESICKTFLRYRVSFRLDKCDFLHPRCEFVGHDITSIGNCPARSKFNLLQDWKLPANGQGLLSFISFCQFYAKFNPLIELKNKALQFLCVPIPPSALTPDLVQLFNESKECILSSPILAGYDPDLPLFLKTDWSASGMSWILMQPARDEESLAAVTTLRETGKNLFDLSPSRPRLLPLSFGSRACSHSEQHWHSFVGEAGTKFLWGLVHPFYWMCDCLAMKEIFKYNGSNSQIARWAQ
ncbi:hypothetical protein CTEN210_12083 [Chaetoceros tenuissimus]|uniref:Reverse transcriptase/retrotransposon-derived protein RNase H-like domain-containing protein n=1 Tax=Chaetoceros tenuissimus TaxID=426638 RepID=A0AAD3H9I0_9STRA|nr:hypothetical protein CTEN210_12083 [Chaetoceros tenuissimus]